MASTTTGELDAAHNAFKQLTALLAAHSASTSPNLRRTRRLCTEHNPAVLTGVANATSNVQPLLLSHRSHQASVINTVTPYIDSLPGSSKSRPEGQERPGFLGGGGGEAMAREEGVYLHGLGNHERDYFHDGLVGAALPKGPQALCYGASSGDIHAYVLHTQPQSSQSTQLQRKESSVTHVASMGNSEYQSKVHQRLPASKADHLCHNEQKDTKLCGG